MKALSEEYKVRALERRVPRGTLQSPVNVHDCHMYVSTTTKLSDLRRPLQDLAMWLI